MRGLLVLLLALALSVAGCLGSNPPPADPGGQPGGPGGSGGNNTTGPNTTLPGAPREIHNATYTYSPQPPAEATFTVPAGLQSLDVAITAAAGGPACIATGITVTITSPGGTSETIDVGQEVAAACSLGGQTSLAAEEGDWTLSFQGTGTVSLQVTVTAR